ncbi:hypothetical protein [Parasphingorhabdus litoris]|uniref:hypothetical protein n=1 Tax=Parasphingorhabdus litoris TaxID=394733 RepID=UPI001E3A0F45|nr:hypothetical protein [Parasphingorhabdus litoris]
MSAEPPIAIKNYLSGQINRGEHVVVPRDSAFFIYSVPIISAFNLALHYSIVPEAIHIRSMR